MPEHYFTAEPTSELKLRSLTFAILGIELRFLTASGVFSHRRVDTGTRVLLKSMKIPNRGQILDLGCGWGVIGVFIAMTHPEARVVMTDINKRAVRLAVENVKLNKTSAEVRCGDLYEPVSRMKFDAIVSNPPISAGFSLIIRLINEAYDHLNRGGSIQLVARKRKGGRTISKILSKAFGNVQEIEKKSGYTVYLSRKENEIGSEQPDKRV